MSFQGHLFLISDNLLKRNFSIQQMAKEIIFMNKTVKLGMTFQADNVPDFGSIEMNPYSKTFYLLAEDIPKLNSTLTKTVCTPYLENDSDFCIQTGDTAYILDWITAETGAMYIYHSGTDSWYEVLPGE